MRIGVGNRGEQAGWPQRSRRQNNREMLFLSLGGVLLQGHLPKSGVPFSGGGQGEGMVGGWWLLDKFPLSTRCIPQHCFASPKSLAPKPSMFIPHTPDGSCFCSTQGIAGRTSALAGEESPQCPVASAAPSVVPYEVMRLGTCVVPSVFFVFLDFTLQCDTANGVPSSTFNGILLEICIFTIFKSVGIKLHAAVSWFLNKPTPLYHHSSPIFIPCLFLYLFFPFK